MCVGEWGGGGGELGWKVEGGGVRERRGWERGATITILDPLEPKFCKIRFQQGLAIAISLRLLAPQASLGYVWHVLDLPLGVFGVFFRMGGLQKENGVKKCGAASFF